MRSYIERILRYCWLVIGLTLLVTGGLAFQAKNLNIIIDPNTVLPQSHPYVSATNKVEEVFGSKYVVVIGITPSQGDIFQPEILGKVQRITAALLETPGAPEVSKNFTHLSS
jgi:uncharacterized protein